MINFYIKWPNSGLHPMKQTNHITQPCNYVSFAVYFCSLFTILKDFLPQDLCFSLNNIKDNVFKNLLNEFIITNTGLLADKYEKYFQHNKAYLILKYFI